MPNTLLPATNRSVMYVTLEASGRRGFSLGFFPSSLYSYCSQQQHSPPSRQPPKRAIVKQITDAIQSAGAKLLATSLQ